LGDPDVQVRASLHYSPDPNPVQRQSFARAYIEANRPADALVWLQDSWGHMEDSRQGLLAEALEKLGRFDESVPIRRAMFERTLSDYYLDLWLKHLAEPARADAIACARKLALAHKDPARAATVLLQIGDADAAEEKLLTNPGGIDGGAYGSLVPLAKALRNHDCPRGETVIYRALLNGILDRAYARAYGHAARYWARLREIANSGVDLLPLSPPDAFDAEIRARHARKTAFWAHVNSTRRDRHDVEDDD
jgi:tetratricopeptide (TPR) repeat protein